MVRRSARLGVVSSRLAVFVLALGLLLALAAAGASPSAQAAATCSDYVTQAEAQRAADTRDADGDGIYCESLPCPCLKPGADPKPKPKPPPKVTKLSGRITDVVDGDTIKARAAGKTYTVRLIGIDTPETKKPGTPVECGGREATDSMLRLAFTAPTDTNGDGLLDRKGGQGRSVVLTGDRTQDRFDRFGRLLAYATAAGKSLAVEQLAAGWSDVYVFDKRFLQYPRFTQARDRAKNADRGAWTLCDGDFHRPR